MLVRISTVLRLVVAATAVLAAPQSTRKSEEKENGRIDGIHAAWLDSHSIPKPTIKHGERVLKEIPQYVLDYAPLVHLHSDERYWPSLMEDHLAHTVPALDFTPIHGLEDHPSLYNLGDYNLYDQGVNVHLQSRDDVSTDPEWITSEANIPVNVTHTAGSDDDEDTEVAPKPPKGGRSDAPAILIVVEKEDGIVDAFWFFFYSYNLGNSVFGVGFGDHVGDWEHTTVRFIDGKPSYAFLSEHEFGSHGYTFEALEKYNQRPVVFSGRGTHAMYATPGIQAYILPFAILHDTTDRGPLWDPTLNLLSYHYVSPGDGSDTSMSTYIDPETLASEYHNHTFTPSTANPDAPVSWLYFGGWWGDKEYPSSDPRQYHAPVVGEKKFVTGPHGPRFKALGRKAICPSIPCTVKETIAPRLWLINWLINWAWACSILLALATILIVTIFVLRHAEKRRRAWWQRWEQDGWMGREGRRRKTMADVERSPLVSASASESTSLAEGEVEPPARGLYGAGYGTIEVIREDGWDRDPRPVAR